MDKTHRFAKFVPKMDTTLEMNTHKKNPHPFDQGNIGSPLVKGGFVGEGGARERASEREREGETTGYEASREAQTVVAGEGGACRTRTPLTKAASAAPSSKVPPTLGR